QLRLAAPRDSEQLRELLREAVAVSDAPTAVRYAKGSLPEPLDAVGRHGTVDVLDSDDDPDVLIVAVGALAHTGMEAAAGLRAAGIGVRVVDPRWVKPLDPVLDEWSRHCRLIITIEDNGRAGGVGAALTARLQDRDITTPITVHAIPQEFLDHAKRADILERVGLTAERSFARHWQRWRELRRWLKPKRRKRGRDHLENLLRRRSVDNSDEVAKSSKPEACPSATGRPKRIGTCRSCAIGQPD